MSTPGSLQLDGLDGSNPLAFMAALGTLRMLDSALGEDRVCLGWSFRRGVWRASISLPEPFEPETFVALLHDHLRARDGSSEFDLGRGADNLTVEPNVFREFAMRAMRSADPADRTTADFAAALSCEAAVDRRGKAERIQDTALRTMSGSGHQHFLGTMRNLVIQTGPEHLRKTLFSDWRYDDPLKSLSMRWEPTEDRRHAYQWADPTDASERRTGSMLGANRLAIEALPFFPTVPINRPGGSTELKTLGFRRTHQGRVEWTWPIWRPSLPSRVIASLLASAEIQKDSPRPSQLQPLGIVAAFRSTRISVDYYRNFTPAVAVYGVRGDGPMVWSSTRSSAASSR